MGIKGEVRFEKKPLELIRPRKNLPAMKEGIPVLVCFIPCLGFSRIQEGLSLWPCGGYDPQLHYPSFRGGRASRTADSPFTALAFSAFHGKTSDC